MLAARPNPGPSPVKRMQLNSAARRSRRTQRPIPRRRIFDLGVPAIGDRTLGLERSSEVSVMRGPTDLIVSWEWTILSRIGENWIFQILPWLGQVAH
jgi:hypothetical protein